MAYYKTTRWERKRERILRRDGYKCQDAARYGKNVPANTVHHIFPRQIWPEYEWEDWNLISLSSKAHDEMHDRVTGDLTQKGWDLLERTARRRGIQIRRTTDAGMV